MATIIVARHCQTQFNLERRLQGSRFDLNLTDVGRYQAEMMCDRIHFLLQKQKVDRVYCSPTLRAMETAKIICPEAQIITNKKLLPFDIGTADGKKPEEIISFKRVPIPGIYKKMENIFSYYIRTKQALKEVLQESKDGITLIITHEDISAMFEKLLMKKPIYAVPNLGLKNGEFRIYDIQNYDNVHIKSGKFHKLKANKMNAVELEETKTGILEKEMKL